MGFLETGEDAPGQVSMSEVTIEHAPKASKEQACQIPPGFR
jgi:hypothetical protein